MEVFLSMGEKGIMAVLKDLIVHGSSRFLNTSYFNQLNTNKIGAEEGIFNKIVATTGDIGSLTVDDLTAGKATVLSLLDVRGELHTNQWTNSNIATIDGSFYITPTIGVPSGTMTTTANSVVINGSNFPISSLYVNGVNSDNTATTVAWTSGSKVLVTGEILVNGVYMPLGTLIGTLSANATASQIQVGSITDNRYQSAESLAEIGTQSTALPCRNVKVSLYQTSRSSTLYPLGIFMTALGENGKTFLDIYGGGYATSTAAAGGFARPVLRIGNLAGLPAVGGKTPVGYGIYTSNGYFSGTIVSKSGTIGGYTLDDTSLYSGTKGNSTTSGHFTLTTDTFTRAIDGTSRSNLQMALGAKFGVASDGTLYANGANITNINANNISTNLLTAIQAKVSTLSAITADMGTLTAGKITTNSNRTTYNGTQTGLTLDMNGIGAGNGTTNTFKVDASTGALTAGNATLTGGTIAGWSFNTTSLYKNNATPGASTSTMVISTGTASTNNIGGGGTTSKTWMLSAGTGFGVTTAGVLYASGANISGTLSAGANSTIGPWTVTANSIYKGNATYGTSGTGNMYFGDSGLSISNVFKVSNAGALTTSNITATSGTIGGWTINSSYGIYTNSKISSTSTNTGILIQKDGNIYAGAYNSTLSACPFQVTSAGVLNATEAILNGVTIKDSNGKTRAVADANGFKIYDLNGTAVVASFGSSTIELGKNSDTASILFCNSKGQITYTSTLGLIFRPNITDTSVLIQNGSQDTQISLGFNQVELWAQEGDTTSTILVNGSYDDTHSSIELNTNYVQVMEGGSLWYMGPTTPPSGTQTYTAVWHKSGSNNYGLYRPSSSIRYKKDVENICDPLLDPHKLYNVRVVQFRYKNENENDPNNPPTNPTLLYPGFIAEEMAEAYPVGAVWDNGQAEDWNNRHILPPMLKLIQEQHEEIEHLKKEIQILKSIN